MVPRYLAFVLTAVLLSPFSVAPVLADSCVEGTAKIALHVTAPTTKIPCGVSPVTCGTGINTTGDLNQEYRVYLILTGISSNFIEIQIGIDYDAAEGSGVDVLGFQACAPTTTPIGNWPDPGSELRMTYGSCQSDMASDPVMLGWFNVIAHTPGYLSVVYPGAGNGTVQPGTVPRLVTCDLTEKVLDPYNQGEIALGGDVHHFNPCTDFADAFLGPCCLPDNSCQENTSVGCCWAQGGRRLQYTANCSQCLTPVLTNTWGHLKSRY